MNDTEGPDFYPHIEPYERGTLPVPGGHTLAYELCGNPDGWPALFVHGGPGAGCTPTHRRFFDPKAYRIVLFDQRGCGRSTPNASVENNTTQDLVADMERLRNHLRIDRWLVFGGSWGSTLSLAYAASHWEQISALVLRGIWLCRESDRVWFFETLRSVYPDHWRDFVAPIPPQERGDLLGAYHTRLMNPDPAVHLPAAATWDHYETRCSTLLPLNIPATAPGRLALSRLEAHYMKNRVFLRENELLEAVPRFRHVPATIVHGRYDMLCPLEGAAALASAWPEATFEIVPDAGHAATEPGIRRRLVRATDKFRLHR